MAIQLLVAPAATGKMAHVLDLTRDAARGLGSTPRVVTAKDGRRLLERQLQTPAKACPREIGEPALVSPGAGEKPRSSVISMHY